MSEKQVKAASAADIMREFDSVCLESDSENVNNMAAATSDTCANVKTQYEKSSSKSRSSTSASKNKSTKSKVSVDSRIDLLEKKMDEQLGSILHLVQTLANPSSSQRDTGVLAPGQRPVLQDEHPAGVSGPVSEEAGSIGRRRPLISLENDIDSDFAIQPVTLRQDHPDDTLSLTPAQREKDSLGLLSDNDDSVSCKSVGTDSVLSLSEALAPGQRPVLQDEHPAGVSGPVSEEAGPIGTRRPLISLENDIDSDFAIQPVTLRQDHPDDTLSLTPAQREKDSLGLLSDNDDSVSCKSVGTDLVLSRKANRFCQYLSDTPEKSQNNLAHLFGEEAGLKQSSETGICLDQAQIDTNYLKHGVVNTQKDYLLSEMNIDLFFQYMTVLYKLYRFLA